MHFTGCRELVDQSQRSLPARSDVLPTIGTKPFVCSQDSTAAQPHRSSRSAVLGRGNHRPVADPAPRNEREARSAAKRTRRQRRLLLARAKAPHKNGVWAERLHVRIKLEQFDITSDKLLDGSAGEQA
jgi:hypothetical protein